MPAPSEAATNQSSGFAATRILFLGFAATLFAVRVHAETIFNPIGTEDFQELIKRFVDYALVLLTPLSVIMVLLTGYFYMTAGGNEEKVKRAHKTLIWTVIGIAIVLLAKSAQIIIETALGVEGAG